jgi:uncharacterized protein (TIGR03546 family)
MPWKPLKKILKILKSSLSPNQIAFSFALGIFAGLPPLGLHVILPITLALLVRCSFRAFLHSMGLFELISLAVAPGSYAIGCFLLDANRGLDGLWRVLFHLPIAAPMGYGRYLLFGSLVLSLLMAIPVFFLVRFLVIKYRCSFTTWVAGWRISNKLRDRRGIGVLRFLLTGGEAKYEHGKAPWGPFRYVRREMLIILPIVYVFCYLLAAVIVPFFAGRIATSAASFVVGGDVAVEERAFSLFTGRLNLEGLSVQDPGKPEENVLEIPSLTLDVGMLPLIEKRVVFNNVRIGEVFLHVEREADGTLNIDDFTSGWNAEGYLDWAAKYADKVDWFDLLRHFIEYLGEPRPRKPPTDFSRYPGGRSFPGFRPSFAVERIEIGRIHLTLDDVRDPGAGLPPLTLIEVELSNLAFPAHLNRDPMIIALKGRVGDDPESAFLLSAHLDDCGEVPEHRYDLELRKIDLVRIAKIYETTLPVLILSGRATCAVGITIRGNVVSGEVSLLVEDLSLAEIPGRPLFGLSADLSTRVVEGINRYARDLPVVIGLAIDGWVSSPQVHWEEPLLEIAREGLLMEGRRELQGAIDSLGLQIDALGPAVEVPLQSGYEELREQAEERATELIRGGVGGLSPPDFVDPLKGLFEELFPVDEEEGS